MPAGQGIFSAGRRPAETLNEERGQKTRSDGVQRLWIQVLEQFPEIMGKRKRGRGLQDKAEDAGGLTPVRDDNEVMRFPDR